MKAEYKWSSRNSFDIIGVMGELKGMVIGFLSINIIVKFLDMLRILSEYFLANNINDMLKDIGQGDCVQYNR